MAYCSCGNPAVYRTYDGVPVCMPCWNTFQQNLNQSIAAQIAMINYLDGMMNWMVGLPGSGPPPIRIPQPTHVHGPINMNTTNNIKVEAGSQVGQINAGAINFIDRCVTVFKQGDETKAIADELRAFAQAVLDSQELSSETQKQVLELLQSLLQQAGQGEKRNPSLIRLLLQGIGAVVSASTAIAAHWEKLKAMFEQLFQLAK